MVFWVDSASGACGLRGTGKNRPKGTPSLALDDDIAEYAMWIGSPLLYQWVVNIRATIIYLCNWNKSPLVLVGIGPLAIPSIIAAACFPELVDSLILFDAPVSYVCETYAAGTLMGLLAPGILKVGDIPHLAGLLRALADSSSRAASRWMARSRREGTARSIRLYDRGVQSVQGRGQVDDHHGNGLGKDQFVGGAG